MQQFITFASILAMSVGCTADRNRAAGFTLPDGNSDRGQQTFVQLHCNACHSVAGVEFETHAARVDTMIPLGGETSAIKTYGNLVTSIINPSHRFAVGYAADDIKKNGESKMRIYNDQMTITQLTDLVAFLQSHYRLKEFTQTPYMPYP